MAVTLGALAGTSLGTRSVSYTERDVILYALAVGAAPTQLDLVYETRLKTLPTFGLTLGLWVVEAAGSLGAYDPVSSLHASQSLQVHRALPPTGRLDMAGEVGGVWDKGKATVVDVAVSCDYFSATYSIFLSGRGGWGGPRGSAATPVPHTQPSWTRHVPTALNQAVLYRLTGDQHPLHVDPEVATQAGFTRPILHGLCTLGIVAREVAAAGDVDPWLLQRLQARLAAPVYPGDTLTISGAADPDGGMWFEAEVEDTVVLRGGRAAFFGGSGGSG